MAKLKIVHRKIGDLSPYENNARTHTDTQIKQIAASITEFGFNGRWNFCDLNDCYVATDSGEILRVCRRQRTKSGGVSEIYITALLRGSLDKYGYRTYRIAIDGAKKHLKGHRIVAAAFLGDGGGLQVNHKDGNKTNNRVENLQWCTAAQNQSHAIRTGLKNPHRMNIKVQKIPFWEWTTVYALAEYGGVNRNILAEMNGVCRQTIDNIIRKVRIAIGGEHARI